MELSTTYLGHNLKNPVVASSSPLTSSLDGLRRLEDAGAVVLGPGQYRFTDFFKVGVLLQLILLAATLAVIPLLFPLQGT